MISLDEPQKPIPLGENRLHHSLRISKVVLVGCIVALLSVGVAMAGNGIPTTINLGIAKLVKAFSNPNSSKPLTQEMQDFNQEINKNLSHSANSLPIGKLWDASGRTLATTTDGDYKAMVAATPTDSEGLCVSIQVTVRGVSRSDLQSATCHLQFDDDHPVFTTGVITSDVTATAGVVRDDVKALDFKTTDGWISAPLHKGAFVIIWDDIGNDHNIFRVTFNDGRQSIFGSKT